MGVLGLKLILLALGLLVMMAGLAWYTWHVMTRSRPEHPHRHHTPFEDRSAHGRE